MNEFRRNVIILIGLSLFSTLLYSQTTSDEEANISLEPQGTWQFVTTENALSLLSKRPDTTIRPLGMDLEKEGLIGFDFVDGLRVIPALQISVIKSVNLSVNKDAMELVDSEIEHIYSQRIRSKFRRFLVEPATIANLRAIRISGVYTWQSSNIKILQYLIPGTRNLYSATYTALEREFDTSYESAMATLSTLKISDKPLYLGWLWSWLKFLGLVVIVGAIFFGLLFANRIRRESAPAGKQKPSATSSSKKYGRGSDPFTRKR